MGVVATLLLLRDRKSSSPSDNSTMAENARDSVDITDLPNSAPLSGTLPGKAAKRDVVSQKGAKISRSDIDHWLELPKEEWKAEIEVRTEGLSEVARAELMALMREFQEAQARRGFTKEHPDYLSRRTAIVDRYSELARARTTEGAAGGESDAEAAE
jgi:hypothetical protein